MTARPYADNTASKRPQRPKRRPRRNDSPWHWLLLVPTVVPLLTPFYNKLEPSLLGLPFFYWCQMAFVGLTILITTIVYQATKRRT